MEFSKYSPYYYCNNRKLHIFLRTHCFHVFLFASNNYTFVVLQYLLGHRAQRFFPLTIDLAEIYKAIQKILRLRT